MKQNEKDENVMETVLVVEDSRAMQRTLQRLLEADSLQVQIASDGITGLEAFRKQPPSAVLPGSGTPWRMSVERSTCVARGVEVPSAGGAGI